MISSIDSEKIFGNISHSFMIKTLKTIEIKVNYLKLTKASMRKPVNILNGERLTVFPLRLETRQKCLPLPLLLNIIIKVLASTVR